MSKGGTVLILIIITCIGWYMYKLGYFDTTTTIGPVVDQSIDSKSFIPSNLENLINDELNKYSTESNNGDKNKGYEQTPFKESGNNQRQGFDKKTM